MAYDIQLTVIIYKKKQYISHIAALSLSESLQDTSILTFGNRLLVEVKPKDKKLIAHFPVYDMDSMLDSFVPADKNAEVLTVSKKDTFTFEGMTFISLSKLDVKNKYSLRFSLPAIKMFGTYYILCGKQKDVNTRIIVKTE
jgi:hypothetical protein